jgi:hypothetical protein
MWDGSVVFAECPAADQRGCFLIHWNLRLFPFYSSLVFTIWAPLVSSEVIYGHTLQWFHRDRPWSYSSTVLSRRPDVVTAADKTPLEQTLYSIWTLWGCINFCTSVDNFYATTGSTGLEQTVDLLCVVVVAVSLLRHYPTAVHGLIFAVPTRLHKKGLFFDALKSQWAVNSAIDWNFISRSGV